MDIHHLRVFATVFRNRSFSKASEELYLTQPTVSDHIKALEEELHCRLFDRLGRSIAPTREADILYSSATEIIERTDALIELVGQFKKDVSGKLVIGASTIPGTYVIPHLIAGFKKSYPTVSFQIVETDSKGVIEKILRHELLLGMVGAKIGNGNLIYTPVMEEELIAVSSPSLIKAHEMSLEELTKLPMILREEGSGTRREIERIMEGGGISLDALPVVGYFGSTGAVKQAVKAGLGISILSELAVKDEVKYKLLKKIRIKGIQMKRKFYTVTHRKRTLPFSYSMFVDYLKKHLRIPV
ncbi:MAG TPA: selenium metabolism-associated LysR family transcriptional regulator [Thermodesulfovibrionales bacterium]|nr:selenium metabolism-associated LysR family transcriptional regulator [Thermodesulfovibrionales bacterium]